MGSEGMPEDVKTYRRSLIRQCRLDRQFLEREARTRRNFA
ncbi:hypothetical protein K239x_04880 [Planctomycetes bacterium K23_9]|uniref:Uncharacterized protein n=1 Tax=Stieleria marina TaxID=1930275 RepID=A0A517NN55_9BACT|nr:hypothetical protein K239x_04880 [Planctomycetes bacterium K23_9]